MELVKETVRGVCGVSHSRQRLPQRIHLGVIAQADSRDVPVLPEVLQLRRTQPESLRYAGCMRALK